MGSSDLPTFPEFQWDEYFWITSARLPAWSGYQRRSGSYGSRSAEDEADTRSDGTVQILFAPEGRGEGPLTDEEIALVQWVIDHQAAVHDAMLTKLFEGYPAMRERAWEWFDEKEAEILLPQLQSPDQLKDLFRISGLNVHQIEQDGRPFIGIELGCDWETEHGVGILLHGDQPLEIGGGDTAILLWIAKKHLRKPK